MVQLNKKTCEFNMEVVGEMMKNSKTTVSKGRKKGKSISEGQKARNQLFDFLRKQATGKHNLTAGLDDEFHAVRRPLTYKLRRKHYKNCCNQSDILRRPKNLGSRLIGKRSTVITNNLQKVLLPLRDDAITDAIMNDDLILEYENSYAYKHRHSPHLGAMTPTNRTPK
ncbi:hypothetical protein TSAR_004226 [Trichomalopsis sarcophagae]|uniref:Uncharacterized protein n=1 Tax=Trichomalopsis sarcophagae TaxID=543379 RepID=A0A232EQ70_9HYME|nr:hypothetical protein TSAR_004226 [Trichomalopsis sarcophagae]